MIGIHLLEYDRWWISLPIEQKERIAANVLQLNGMGTKDVTYPSCTNVWLQASVALKEDIYMRLTSKRELLEEYLTEGWAFSY